MNEMLHAEMKAGTLRLAGNHRGAAAVEAAAAKRCRVLALADAQYVAKLDEDGRRIREVANRLALANVGTPDLDQALQSSPAALTPRQTEALLTERGELIRAARVAYGPMPPPGAKEKIRRWAVEHLQEFGRVLRMMIDIPSEAEQVLAALYGDGQPAASTPASPSTFPAVPPGAVAASQAERRPSILQFTDMEGRPLARPLALTT